MNKEISKEVSAAGRAMAKSRWENTTLEQRSKHGKNMVNARELKKKQNV